MNSDIDVLKELEVKNREIYLNKLHIDLDNNLEILLITIENMISLFTNEVTSKIMELNTLNCNRNELENEVLAFHIVIKDELINLVNNRNSHLKGKILNIDSINYKDILAQETKGLMEKLSSMYSENVTLLIDKIMNKFNGFDKQRLDLYLKVLNYEKFINKVKEAINNMDIILYNNYRESYQKFLNLNAKTLKE